MNAYDALRYPSRSYVQTHPDRLAMLATLMGLQPAAPSACRALEIGCGDGTNLLAMAAELPGSEFVGVDLAESAIASARRAAAELGLTNVAFHGADLATITRAEFGAFDYVIAHGVFSWVPEPVRRGLLALSRDLLPEHGVAYISYNAYPGCHLREMNRGMMRYHVRHIDDPAEQITQARALMNLLVHGRRDSGDAYHRALVEGLEHALEYNEAAFFHDDLSEVNQPYYFHEFMALAAAHGLQFVSEADLRDMHGEDDDSPVAGLLDQLGQRDCLVKEQYLDFLQGRRFRQTLLTPAGATLDRTLHPAKLTALRMAAQLEPAPPPADAEPGTVCYQGPRGSSLTATHPVLQRALATLAPAWPQSVAFDELAAAAGTDNAADRERLGRFLLRAAMGGALEFRFEPSPLVLAAGERPLAGRFARWQIPHGASVTTLHHTRVRIDDPAARALLRLMDGSRDRAMLARDGAAALAQDGVVLVQNEREVRSAAELEAFLAASLDGLLAQIGRLGLLRA